ncbi:MAG: glycoside hydrolase family 31 protein [Chitinophagales bacterium]|nr:glycoside hydrolase family 31 protein [Bacteroidota bacterium]MCB9043833.1 glycoside hydrolase family 31 protein [Chitinophagales bacterium]
MPLHHQSLGAFVSAKTNDKGLFIQAENAQLEITVYAEHTLRIRCNKTLEKSVSYAIEAAPQKTKFTLKETDKFFEIELKNYSVLIQKNPLRIAFFAKDGTLLNADDPAFGISFLGDSTSNYKSLQQGERFIGLGEKTGNFDRRGAAYTLWNTDHFGYGENADPIYSSTPFYVGILPEQEKLYGIFLNNSYKSVFNFGASNDRFSYFTVQGGDLDYFFFHADTLSEIVNAYTTLSGQMPLPPKWSLGYQQCRYSYYPQAEIMSVARTFREKNIPADVIYFDIHYMQDYKVFTWNETRFPQAKKMLSQLDKMGFKGVVILDPGIKVEPDYPPYETGLAQDVFVKYPDGENYTAQVWPGDCHFPDFTNPKTREWWASYFKQMVADGLHGFWNDMNEPASWGQFMPDLLQFDYEGEGACHIKARNVYGMQMTRASYEGAVAALKNKRPFILTRAAFSGAQRYTAKWTGDNVASDSHMLLGVRLVNSLGISGFAFSGYDCGGFVGDASPDLYARWVSIGAFSPFFRGHTMINSHDSEPWSYGEAAEDIARNYISLRYQMLPYLYSSFYEASQNGMPVQRSMAFAYPFDANIYSGDFQNQYFFGKDLLVAPCDSVQKINKVYLPTGKWYDFFNDQVFEGGKVHFVETPIEKLPVFVKESAIIPVQSLVQHTRELPEKTLTIHLYNGSTNNIFVYYEDDGESFDYQKKVYFQRELHWNASEKTFTLAKAAGSFVSHFDTIKLCLHHFSRKTKVLVHKKEMDLHFEDYYFVKPISSFDPLGNMADQSKMISQLPFVMFENSNQEVRIVIQEK